MGSPEVEVFEIVELLRKSLVPLYEAWTYEFGVVLCDKEKIILFQICWSYLNSFVANDHNGNFLIVMLICLEKKML